MRNLMRAFFALFVCTLILGACSCEERGKLVGKPPVEGGSGGEGGGGWIDLPTPCESMCMHLEDTCHMQVEGLDEDCASQCEETLNPEQIACLRQINCTFEEVRACLGGDPCEAICPMVYEQCGREIYYRNTAIQAEDCPAFCPQLAPEYRACLAAAPTCPAIDACRQEEPEPQLCEEMCERVYGFCGERIEQPGRSYPSLGRCKAACADEAFSEEEISCLSETPCSKLDECFGPGPGEPTACELMCEKIYDDCHYSLPVRAKKEDRISKERCVSNCEGGKYSQVEMSCVEEEVCDQLATCFDAVVTPSCASTCYWIYNYCDVELGLTFGCMGGDCPQQCWTDFGGSGDTVWFVGEGQCFDTCQSGYNYQGHCNPRRVSAWSEGRKACYRQLAQDYQYHQCKPDIFTPMDVCDAYDPEPTPW